MEQFVEWKYNWNKGIDRPTPSQWTWTTTQTRHYCTEYVTVLVMRIRILLQTVITDTVTTSNIPQVGPYNGTATGLGLKECRSYNTFINYCRHGIYTIQNLTVTSWNIFTILQTCHLIMYYYQFNRSFTLQLSIHSWPVQILYHYYGCVIWMCIDERWCLAASQNIKLKWWTAC